MHAGDFRLERRRSALFQPALVAEEQVPPCVHRAAQRQKIPSGIQVASHPFQVADLVAELDQREAPEMVCGVHSLQPEATASRRQVGKSTQRRLPRLEMEMG